MILDYQFDLSLDFLKKGNPGILNIKDYTLTATPAGISVANVQVDFSNQDVAVQADTSLNTLYSTIPGLVALLATPPEVFSLPDGTAYQYPIVTRQDPLTLYKQLLAVNPARQGSVVFSSITFYIMVVSALGASFISNIPGCTTKYVVFHKIV